MKKQLQIILHPMRKKSTNNEGTGNQPSKDNSKYL